MIAHPYTGHLSALQRVAWMQWLVGAVLVVRYNPLGNKLSASINGPVL